MRLVLIIVISLISISTLLAQDDSSKVNQNKEKIGELNQRLDKLLEGSKTIDGDSVEQKLRMLFEEIKSIKSSLTELKESVGQLSEELNDVKSLEEKITTIEHGKYYLVLASIRDKSRAAQVKSQLKHKDVLLVQNSLGTWYHLVLSQPMSMKDAILRTAEERKSGVKDAWWVTAKKLKVN
ncbi:MAG: hypothetical protein CMC96_09850 [Flavobacteriales bacterium]|nr:hypothetical protein [Flavobacteriales bacterium]|tara:strand:+ start:74413 stop:74955 length:543 start_codon:yes stop_codon:yes gene_type:complete